ncbi:MAG: hypothetical protein ACRYFW_08690 [Janthinobacterium lividum]
MARTITALFDTRADADAGAARLRGAGVEPAHVQVHDQSSHATTGDHSTREDKGMWASIKNAFLPDADRHAYEEGVRRGGFLLTADVADDNTAEAVAALEDANAIDLDERADQWRSQGWASPVTTPETFDDDLTDAYGVRETERGGVRFRSYAKPAVSRDL